MSKWSLTSKRIVSLVLALTMLVAAYFTASNGVTVVAEEDKPDTWIADRHIRGRMYVGDAGSALPADQINNRVAQKIKELTGITLEWEYSSGTSDLEVMTQAFMTNDVPEVFVSYLDDSSRPEWPVLKQAADAGMLADLSPYLADTEIYSKYLEPGYLPNDSYENILFNEDWDGKAYFLHLGIPREPGSNGVGWHQLNMNMDAAEAIGVDPADITSTEELFDASQKMLDAGLTDRNGAPLVPIGPTVWGGRLQHDFYYSKAFNWNRDSLFNVWEDEVKHVANTPLLEEQVMLVREGIEKGYIDPEAFTMSGDRATEHFMNSHYGFMYMSVWQANDKYKLTGTEWLPVPNMANAFGDDTIHSQAKSGWLVWAISADAENPEEILKFADFLATKEGKEIYMYGIEGEDFDRDEEGFPVLKPEVLEAAENDPTAALNEYNSMAVGSYWARIGYTDNAPMEDFGEWNFGDKLNVEDAEHTEYVATYGDPELTYYDGSPAKAYITLMDENIQRNLGQLLEPQYHEDTFVRAAVAADSEDEAREILANYVRLLEENGVAEFEAKLQEIYETEPETIFFD